MKPIRADIGAALRRAPAGLRAHRPLDVPDEDGPQDPFDLPPLPAPVDEPLSPVGPHPTPPMPPSPVARAVIGRTSLR